MFPESKVTEIYCMADDFCKEFTLQQEKYMIKDMKTMHRNIFYTLPVFCRDDVSECVDMIVFNSFRIACCASGGDKAKPDL